MSAASSRPSTISPPPGRLANALIVSVSESGRPPAAASGERSGNSPTGLPPGAFGQRRTSSARVSALGPRTPLAQRCTAAPGVLRPHQRHRRPRDREITHQHPPATVADSDDDPERRTHRSATGFTGDGTWCIKLFDGLELPSLSRNSAYPESLTVAAVDDGQSVGRLSGWTSQ